MSLKRLGKSIAWRIFPRAELSLKLSSDVRLHLQNRGDFPILQEIFIERSYEPFLEPLGEVRNWVDIGCNCGLFSLFLEHRARERGWPGPRRALLIDPNSLALRTVRASIAANHLESSFALREGAVGGRGSSIQFFESKSTYKSSVFAMKTREKRRVVPLIDLEAETLALGWIPDLVKVDIEGGEKLLIENWSAWLQRARHLIIEWHEPHMKGRDLDRACAGLGFKRVLVRPPEYLKKEKGEPLDQCIGTGLWSRQS